MKAFGVWLAAVIVFCVVMGIWSANGEELEVFVALLVWGAGLVILVLIGLAAVLVHEGRKPAPTGPRMVCTHCGATLYGQWWSKSKAAYECRNCGQATTGRMSDAE